MVDEMFDLMYEHKGIGLAANQVDLPYRFFVVNATADPAQRGEERVFINPVLSHPNDTDEAEEGCLSLPGVYAPVKRPERITVTAFDLGGQEFTQRLDGLLARVVQHETDHLDGIMFIDRLAPTQLMAIREALAEFELEFDGYRRRGEIPNDDEILSRLNELEQLRA